MKIMQLCVICGRDAPAKNLCTRHYLTKRRNGDPRKIIRNRTHPKTCRLCNEKYYSNGLCKSHLWKDRYKREGHISRQKMVEQRKINRMICLQHYSKGKMVCECCGENNIAFLTLDHINNGGNKQRRELNMFGGQFLKWLIDNDFPEGLQVLCMNCNWGKRLTGICPHKTTVLPILNI